MTPRPYLSYSQLMLFERSPDKYREIYLEGKTPFTNDGMDLGSRTADALENGEATGEADLDFVVSQLPRLEIAEHQIAAEIRVGRKIVPVIAKIDSSMADLSAILEFKTGSGKWTQGKVDRSDQLTFYAMVIWLITKKIPALRLIWAETVREDGGPPRFTGKTTDFTTVRHMGEILRMMERCRKAWVAIEELTNQVLI